MAEAPTVYLVDDEAALRESLKAVLDAAGYRCCAYASGAEFLAADLSARPACAVIDVRMPGMDGLAVQSALHARGVQVPVVFMTGFADVPLAVQAMKSGAVDFVEKPCAPAVLRQAIESALREARAGAQDGVAAVAEARLQRLSPREREVLEWLVAGASNKIIAYELAISPRTVELHRAHVMAKMECKSLSVLVRLALAGGVKPRS